MSRTILFLAVLLSLASCAQTSAIPFEEVNNYFFLNKADLPGSPLIDSSEQFQKLFGTATFMGKDGQPTSIDFDQEFVIAVVYPVTDFSVELAPQSLRLEDGELVFTYLEATGEQQSWTMRPVLLVKVDRKYMKENVRLDRRVKDFSLPQSE